jgi:MFS family permease
MEKTMTTQTGQTTDTTRLETFVKKQHVNTYSILVILFITISSAAYGYAGSIIATTLTQPSFIAHMKLDTASNATSLIGAMNALFYAGAIVGSFTAGWVSNQYGRKASVTLGNAMLLLSGALLTASVNAAMFIVFRFFSGFG